MLTKEQYRSSWYRKLTQMEKDRVNAKAYYHSLEAARTSTKMAKKKKTSTQQRNLTPHQRARIWYKQQAGSETKSSPTRPVILVDSAPYERAVFTEPRPQAEESSVLRRRFQPRSVRSDPPDQSVNGENENHSLAEQSVEHASPIMIDPPTRQLCSTPSEFPRVQPEQQHQLCPVSSHQRDSSHPVWGQQFSAWYCIVQAAAACIFGPERVLGVFLLVVAYGAVQSMWNKPHRIAAEIHQYLGERPNEAIPRATICDLFPCRTYRYCNVHRWNDGDGVEVWQWKADDE